MPAAVQLLLAVGLFLLALRMSAFFSGSEIGFYRLSHLRISLDARAGDKAALRLAKFIRTPSLFVATTLVGNNIVNYLTTLAVATIAIILFPTSAGSAEIAVTLLTAPIIFVFGELLPKSLYFRAPMHFLKRDAWKFNVFYRLFWPVSFPLTGVSRLFERLGQVETDHAEAVLGRNRLTQAITEGHRHGVLTELQNRLVHGLFAAAAQPVSQSAIELNRIIGCADTTARAEMLEVARGFGLTTIPVRHEKNETGWYGYIRVIDLAVTNRPPKSLIRFMPRIAADQNKLEALLQLRGAGEDLGVLVDQQDRVTGIVAENGLAEQLFRPRQPAALDEM